MNDNKRNGVFLDVFLAVGIITIMNFLFIGSIISKFAEEFKEFAIESNVGSSEFGGNLVCISGNRLLAEYIDIETGVHYFFNFPDGLTTRVNEDGTPYTTDPDEWR